MGRERREEPVGTRDREATRAPDEETGSGPRSEGDGQRIFEKWGLDAATIGHTTDTGRLILTHHGETVCDIPLQPLTEDAPLYHRPWVEPHAEPRLDPPGGPQLNADGVVFALTRGVLYALGERDGHVLWFVRVGIDTTTLPVRLPRGEANPRELVLVLSSDANTLTARDAQLRTFPTDLIIAARGIATDVLAQVADKSPAARKVHDSYVAFRSKVAPWSRISLQAILETRQTQG